eukprot:m.472986 g.472986  ORF g.472986 m.472986 type:complete len:141 (+) comp33604_c0_seq1:116-538(+)
MSDTHKNRLDNSEFNTAHSTRDVAPASVDKSEESRLKDYMETLKLRAEIEAQDDLELSMSTNVWNAANNRWDKVDKKVKVRELLPVDSEFEKTRKLDEISDDKADGGGAHLDVHRQREWTPVKTKDCLAPTQTKHQSHWW